ncbi:MAG: TIGR03118 family protein [Nostoc sp.]|uniref:TIGR03118 family protein n=1 Tax=Nostoc sp. TaxID=1180 RepID=UPI002FF5B5DF
MEVTNQPITPNNTYAPTVLVSNRQEYNPQIFDPTFALAWGLAIRPAGFGGHFWVAANGSGASYEYVGDVNIGKPNTIPLFQDDLKLVTVPGPNNTQGTPTGVVFNRSNNFVITQPYSGGDITEPSRFLFATDSGTISAWTERQNGDGTFDRAGTAKIVIDNSTRGDQYFGLAVNPTGDRLFVANFGVNPNIQVFDGTFKEITSSFNGFVNPFVGRDGFQPGEYAPFNIQVLEAPNQAQASVFVAYAKTQENPDNPGQLLVGEEEAGTGLGRIAEFDLTGQLIRTWEDEGLLNSPWGFAYAPDDFGGLSDTLLVSNFSDGTITAFDRNTHQAIDYMRDTTGQPVIERGIWGILFGNGASLGDTNSLYAAIGPEDLGDGVFSRLNYVNLGSGSLPTA